MTFLRRLNAILKQLMLLGSINYLTVFGVAALIIITAMLESVGVALILPLIDFIQSDLPPEEMAEKSKFWRVLIDVFAFLNVPVTLATLSCVIFALVLCRQIVQFTTTMRLGGIRLRVEQNLRSELFKALQNARSQNVQRVESGSFIELMSLQCMQAAVLIESLGRLWGNTIILLAYAVLTLVVATGPSIMAVACVGLGLIALNKLVHMMRQQSRVQVKRQKEFTAWVGERVTGWRLIKLANSVDRETSRLRDHTDELESVGRKIVSIGAITQGIMITAMTLLILAALYVSVTYLDLSIGVVTLFAIVLMRLMPVALGFTRTRQNIENRAASLERITDLQAELIERQEQVFEGDPNLEIRNTIHFNKVSFAYDSDARGALHEITVEIPVGKMTAVVGPSGAGKSTLSDLILCLLEPDSGEIFFDDRNSREFQISSIRRAVAYLPQQPIIFNESVLENVRYMKPEATDAQVQDACLRAYAHDFITDLPDGYQTVLGEGGNKLSGGQRQRIALARALLSDAKVLVLDEPTSALDAASEEMIRKTIYRAVDEGNMTIIIIAHSMTLTQDADFAILLDQGRVVDQGPAKKLLKSSEPDGTGATINPTN